jgi:PBSX family phage portal protein
MTISNTSADTAIATLRETIPVGATTFSSIAFGDPEPVLNKRIGIMDLLQSRFNGRFYETPIPLDGLSRAYTASPHHQSAMNLKRDLLVASFLPTKLLSAEEFEGLALDFVVLANGYLEEIPNRFGTSARYERAIAKYMRRTKAEGTYAQVLGWKQEHEFQAGQIAHLKAASLDQEIYGVPDYVGALQSVFLNEDARLFRRKVYRNGAHLGYILHMDGQFTDGSIEAINDAMDQSKGPGNFRSMLIQSQGGTKDSVRIIPVGEVAAKDEFLAIANTSRDDVLAAHRVFPQLVAVVPQNTGGFGSMKEATLAFDQLVMEPLRKKILQINTARNAEIIAFKDPVSPAD